MKIARLVPLVCLFALAPTACSAVTDEATPLRTAALHSMTPTNPGAQSPIRRLPPVATLTAACPLLSATELKTLVGGDVSRAIVTEIESKPPTARSRLCAYRGQNDLSVGSIEVVETVEGFSPKMAIDYLIKSHRPGKSKMHRVTGVGEAAVFFTYDVGVSRLDASKRSYGQTRTVIFTAETTVPGRKFIDVVKLVLSRI
jgi:hypothetical protein